MSRCRSSINASWLLASSFCRTNIHFWIQKAQDSYYTRYICSILCNISFPINRPWWWSWWCPSSAIGPLGLSRLGGGWGLTAECVCERCNPGESEQNKHWGWWWRPAGGRGQSLEWPPAGLRWWSSDPLHPPQRGSQPDSCPVPEPTDKCFFRPFKASKLQVDKNL